MKLINFKRSPYSSRVRMVIDFKGLDIELTEPDEPYSPYHPVARRPSLHVDGAVIPEAEVICEYLEDLYPEKPLRPTDPLKAAQVRTLSRIADAYVLPQMYKFAALLNPKGREDAEVDKRFEELVMGLTRLNHFLDKDGFAVGNGLTMADCALVPALFILEMYLPDFGKTDQLKQHRKLYAYWQTIQSDPFAAKIIHEQEEAHPEKY